MKVHPVPDFLSRSFDVDDLRREETTTVALDRGGVIAWVNPAWHRFAEENGAPEVADRFGPGTPYLAGISGPLASYFAAVLENVRRTGELWEVEYECSSPTEFRLHRARVIPLEDEGLLIQHDVALVRPHDRAEDAPVEGEYRDARGLMLQCSNCRRVRRPGDGWHWVVSWVAHPPADVSHGLCAACAGHYFAATRRARRVRHREVAR